MTTSNRVSILTTRDGRTFEIPASWPDVTATSERLFGLDANGHPVARYANTGADGNEFVILYGLTACCGASFKGLDGYIGCRACYRPAVGSDMPIGAISEFVR